MELCENGFGNTGLQLSCDDDFKVMRGIFVMMQVANDGTKNYIPSGTVVDAAYLTASVNNTDPSKRWYPIMQLEAVASDRTDPTFFTNPSGAKEFVKQGTRDVSFQKRKVGPLFLGNIQACSCEQLAFFAIDLNGSLRGIAQAISGADLYPVPMQPASFYPNLVQAKEEEPEYVHIQFQYELTQNDALLRVYPQTLVSANLLSATGLVDVYGLSKSITSATSGITTTGFTLTLTTLNSKPNLLKYNPTGLLKANFTLKDITTNSAIAITTVTETALGSGVYTFVIPTTPTSDVKQLTIAANGFDFTIVNAMTFTI